MRLRRPLPLAALLDVADARSWPGTARACSACAALLNGDAVGPRRADAGGRRAGARARASRSATSRSTSASRASSSARSTTADVALAGRGRAAARAARAERPALRPLRGRARSTTTARGRGSAVLGRRPGAGRREPHGDRRAVRAGLPDAPRPARSRRSWSSRTRCRVAYALARAATGTSPARAMPLVRVRDAVPVHGAPSSTAVVGRARALARGADAGDGRLSCDGACSSGSRRTSAATS